MDKKAFTKISYGLYIVSSHDGDKKNGLVVNTACQITADPPKLSVSINKNNLTADYILKSKKFSVSVLSEETSLNLIGKFGFKSGREINKFEDIDYITGKTGAPIVIQNAVAYFEIELENSFDAGTHIIFLGKVIDAKVLCDHGCMTYKYYHEVKGGYASKNAPTYIEKETNQKEGGGKMQKYKCTVCGYIYDPEKGDPENAVGAGTSFEDIPEDWVCPLCGAGKDAFEPVD